MQRHEAMYFLISEEEEIKRKFPDAERPNKLRSKAEGQAVSLLMAIRITLHELVEQEEIQGLGKLVSEIRARNLELFGKPHVSETFELDYQETFPSKKKVVAK